MNSQSGQPDSKDGRTDNESFLMPDMEEWRPELEKLEPEQLLEVALEALSDKNHDEIQSLIDSVAGKADQAELASEPQGNEMMPAAGVMK